MPEHFGVKVLPGKRGLRLTREKYAVVSNKNTLPKFSANIYADYEGKNYTDEWCQQQRKDCLENYDLNMEYFSLLGYDEFCNEIDKFLEQNKGFKAVSDLNLYEGKSGYYLMVLDNYSQVYLGTTNNIKNRIRQHWSTSKSFDRLLFPMGNVLGSVLSIDSFRALDTTRIYACVTTDKFVHEDRFINQIPPKFICNRLAGGRVTGGLLQAIGMIKKRQLK